jgi:hypothetical protein
VQSETLWVGVIAGVKITKICSEGGIRQNLALKKKHYNFGMETDGRKVSTYHLNNIRIEESTDFVTFVHDPTAEFDSSPLQINSRKITLITTQWFAVQLKQMLPTGGKTWSVMAKQTSNSISRPKLLPVNS